MAYDPDRFDPAARVTYDRWSGAPSFLENLAEANAINSRVVVNCLRDGWTAGQIREEFLGAAQDWVIEGRSPILTRDEFLAIWRGMIDQAIEHASGQPHDNPPT